MRSQPHQFVSAAACAALLTHLAACSTVQQLAPPTVQTSAAVIESAANRPSLSDQDEERMAQQAAAAFEDSASMWEDELLETYITDITQRLVAVAHPRPFRYRVRVVNDPVVNAFTFGGGLIYVHAGLIARMENEAQLAMVLGHEIAHVTERHIPEGIEKAWSDNMIGAAAAEALRTTGTLEGQALEIAYGYSMAAMVSGQGRGRESEADEVGLEYLVNAGYQPREAPQVFQILLKEYGDQAPITNFFWGSHPTNTSRFKRTNELIESRYADAGAGLIVDTEEFKRRTREVVIAMGVLDYEEKRYNTARAMFEKAAPVSEDDPVPHYYVGKIALETGGVGEIDKAIAHFKTGVKADPEYSPIYRELGLSYYRKGERPKAVKTFERYLSLEPGAEDADRVRKYISELKRY